MVVEITNDDSGDNKKHKIQEIIVENACQEYNDNVKRSLDSINKRLDYALVENYADLEELEENIAARSNYLEKNPEFLTSLRYTAQSIRIDSLREFDEIRITLKEHSRRIVEKLENIENYHQKLFQLVVKNSREALDFQRKNLEELEEEFFQDCIERDFKLKEKELLTRIPEEDYTDNFEDVESKTEPNLLPSENEPELADSVNLQQNVEEIAVLKEAEAELDFLKKPEPEEQTLQQTEQSPALEENLPEPETKSPELEAKRSELEVKRPELEAKPPELEAKRPELEAKRPELEAKRPELEAKRPELAESENKEPNFEIPTIPDVPKPIEVESKLSFDKVTIQKNAFSDMSLNTKLIESLPTTFQLFPDIIPDVHRRKPLEDLHGKLVQQLEASDSFEGFKRLMERKPSRKQSKTKKNENLEKKYSGSLWFFPDSKDVKKQTSSKNTLSPSKTSQNATKVSKFESTCFNLTVTGSSYASSPQERMRKTKSNLERTKLRYYDLLDDLDGKDLKPIKSEYPRKDNIKPNVKPKTLNYSRLKLKDAKSYLHWMMQENEGVWKKLLQPPPLKKKSSNQENSIKKKKRKKSSTVSLVVPSEHKLKKKSVRSLASSTSTSSEAKKAKNSKKVKNLIEYLTSPEQKFLDSRPQTLIVMPVKVIYDNFPTKEISPPPPLLPPQLRAPAQKISPVRTPSVDHSPIRVVPPINLKTEQSPKRAERSLPTLQQQSVKSPHKVEASKSHEVATKTSDSTSLDRQNEMLKQLQGLKSHNDVIQKNIQKAIDVIETKMIDLLSTSAESSNCEAFNAMEQEITKVLKMMDDEEVKKKKKKPDKIEAEKDENGIKSPKLRRGSTIVRKSNSEQQSETSNSNKKNNEDEKTKKEEMRRAANIEEGERLLGQVDSVIKKIDSIYTRFYDENKLKKGSGILPKNLDNKDEGDTTEIYCGYVVENIAEKFQEAKWYKQTRIYHKIRMEFPTLIDEERKKKLEKKQKELDARRKEIERRKKEDLLKKEEARRVNEALERKRQEEENLKIKEERQKKLDEMFEDDTFWECEQINISESKKDNHESTLTAFYALFFSGVFLVMNFDYTA